MTVGDYTKFCASDYELDFTALRALGGNNDAETGVFTFDSIIDPSSKNARKYAIK